MSVADWSKRFRSAYRYMRVSRATGLETERLGGIRDGGTITRNLDTDIKDSGEVEIVGPLDIGPDLVRVWMDVTWLHDGSRDSVALGTFLVSTDDRETDGSSSESTMAMSGRLQELADQQFVQPFQLPAGTNLVSYAAQIARAAGLAVEADASDAVNTEPLYYGVQQGGSDAGSGDSTKLKVVNDLLDRAGFDSARTDPMGTVLMRRSAGIADRAVSWSFVEGADARFLREAGDKLEMSGVANVVYAVFTWQGEDGGTSIAIGSAVNDDPASRWSTVSLGREITARYDYTEAATQEQADAKAAELLAGKRSVARKVTIQHVYAPVSIADAIGVEYPSGEIGGTYGVRSQRLSLVPGCLVETEGRAYASDR